MTRERTLGPPRPAHHGRFPAERCGTTLATGAVRADGVEVRPADIHATLLSSMGISIDPLKNQSPNVISALLR
ncbi:MAG: hypothetical protein HOO96_37350 [Polyangiaceae bacterium]|nr:hypothetical protein [Polyangiaceae bacterium]